MNVNQDTFHCEEYAGYNSLYQGGQYQNQYFILAGPLMFCNFKAPPEYAEILLRISAGRGGASSPQNHPQNLHIALTLACLILQILVYN